ncbi:MAG: alpha-amylase family glycosyl hydrolase [Sumerlaeia bacterium]
MEPEEEIVPDAPAPLLDRPTPPGAPSLREWSGKSIYFLMIDRFADGDPTNNAAHGFGPEPDNPRGWRGGDLRGLIDKLDYIEGMGFDAIWITPIYRQNKPQSYHGYWAWDFYDVDGHFGTMRDVVELREAMHKRGMALMIDVVANHTGDFRYLPGDYEEGAAPPFDKREWFNLNGPIKDFNNQADVESGELSSLDDINQNHPEARAELLNTVRWLREQTGADGFRIDTVKHVPKDFWAEYNAAAGVFCLGEVLHGDARYVAPYQDVLDGLLDFAVYYASDRVFGRDAPMTDLAHELSKDELYREPRLLAPFLDNHDVPRFLSKVHAEKSEQLRRLKLGLMFTFTVRGMPVLYYGTEQAFSGGMDPYNREMMVFDPTHPVYGFVARLNETRRKVPALRWGSTKVLVATETTMVIERVTDQGESAYVVLNNGDTEARVAFPVKVANGQTLYDHFGNATPARVEYGFVRVGVDRRCGAVFAPGN